MKQIPIDIQSYQGLLKTHEEALKQFESLLVAENKKYNLTRVTSSQEVRIRHFLDSLAGLGPLDALSKKLCQPLRIVDIGSGAGFPGLILALVCPAWLVVSVEATEKKVRFQEKVRTALCLQNVQIIHGRSEDLAHQPPFRERFDAVTARALAALPVLTELTLGLIRPGGLGLYWKGSGIAEEVAAADGAIQQMGGRTEEIVPYTLSDEAGESVDFSLVVCRKIHATPEKYPRVFGTIKKTPLGNDSN